MINAQTTNKLISRQKQIKAEYKIHKTILQIQIKSDVLTRNLSKKLYLNFWFLWFPKIFAGTSSPGTWNKVSNWLYYMRDNTGINGTYVAAGLDYPAQLVTLGVLTQESNLSQPC